MSTKSTSPAQQYDFVKETLSLLQDSEPEEFFKYTKTSGPIQRSFENQRPEKIEKTFDPVSAITKSSADRDLERMLSSKKTAPLKFVPKAKKTPIMLEPLPLTTITHQKPTRSSKQDLTIKARLEKQLQDRRLRDQEKAKAAQANAESNMNAIQKAREDRKRRLQMELSGELDKPVEQNKAKKTCRRRY